MPLNDNDREQLVQEILDGPEVQQVVELIARLVEALEGRFAKLNLAVNFDFRSAPQPDFFGTIVVRPGRTRVVTH